jgi:hypothetical protein
LSIDLRGAWLFATNLRARQRNWPAAPARGGAIFGLELMLFCKASRLFAQVLGLRLFFGQQMARACAAAWHPIDKIINFQLLNSKIPLGTAFDFVSNAPVCSVSFRYGHAGGA